MYSPNFEMKVPMHLIIESKTYILNENKDKRCLKERKSLVFKVRMSET